MNRARLIVELPGDAQLWVDDCLTTKTSNERVFNVPELKPGWKYQYILRAEISRNGQTFSETQRVIVQAGAQVTVDFTNLEAARVARYSPPPGDLLVQK